jgi:hypothetical protein
LLDEGARAGLKIRTERLDDVLRERGLPAEEIGLLWMDVQGHESEVLRGASGLLASGVPLVTELWPAGLRLAGHEPLEFTDLLARHYRLFYDLAEPRPASRPVAELPSLLSRPHADLLLL